MDKKKEDIMLQGLIFILIQVILFGLMIFGFSNSIYEQFKKEHYEQMKLSYEPTLKKEIEYEIRSEANQRIDEYKQEVFEKLDENKKQTEDEINNHKKEEFAKIDKTISELCSQNVTLKLTDYVLSNRKSYYYVQFEFEGKDYSCYIGDYDIKKQFKNSKGELTTTQPVFVEVDMYTNQDGRKVLDDIDLISIGIEIKEYNKSNKSNNEGDDKNILKDFIQVQSIFEN